MYRLKSVVWCVLSGLGVVFGAKMGFGGGVGMPFAGWERGGEEKNIKLYSVDLQLVTDYFQKKIKNSLVECEKSSIFAASIDEKKSCLKG